MTVDDHDMNVRVREPRVHNDSSVEQRWSELPGLTEGRRENWMADRAKNALGSAKLASLYLNQERDRIGRLRKTKSVLALGKFIGKDANRRRHRPYPKKLNRPQNQGHGKSSKARGRFLRDGSLPSLTSTKPGDPTGSATGSGVSEVSVPRRSSRNSFAGKGVKKNNLLLHGESFVSSPALDGRVRAIVPISLALHMKGSKSRTNPPRGTRRTDSHSPYVPGDLFHHSVQRHLKDELSPKAWWSYDAAKDRGHTISSEPSAIDFFDQHELVPEPATRLEEEVSMTQQSNRRVTNDFGGGHSTFEKPAAVRNFLATTASVARPLPLGGGASSELCDVRYHEETAGYHEPRTCNATRDRVSISPQSYGFASRSPSVASPGPKYLTSTERWECDTEMSGNIQRHVNTAEHEVLDLRQSNFAPIETKIPATSERGEGEWNTVKASPPLFSPTTIPKASDSEDEAKETSSEQRLVNALVCLQNNKYLDALRNEYIEALTTLKNISCPPQAVSPNTTGENIQRKLDAAVQAARMGKRLLGRSDSATKIFGEDAADNTSDAPDSSAEAPEGEVSCSRNGVEDLSANLPRIGSRERETLRLLYREWWMQLARGGSVSCLPEPYESPLREGSFPVADRQAKKVNVGGNERGVAKLGTQGLAQLELRRNLVQGPFTTRDDIALATEVEFSGSLRDVAATVSASLKVRQTLGGGGRDERRIGSVIETGNSLNVVCRPQVMYDCTGNAASATPVPPSTNTCDATDNAGHVNYCRKRALSLGSAEDLAQNEQNNQGHARARAMTLSSAADLTRDDHMTHRLARVRATRIDAAAGLAKTEPLGYTGTQSNEGLIDVRQDECEKKAVPRFFQDVAAVFTSTNTAVETEAGSPGNLGAIRGNLPASAGVHLVSVGVGTHEWRRGNMGDRSSSSDASRPTHELVEGTRVTTSLTPLSLATTTYGKGDGGHTSVAPTEERDFPPGSKSRSIQFNKVANNTGRRKERDLVRPYPQDAITASTRKHVAVETDIQLPLSLFNVPMIPQAFSEEKLTLERTATNQPCISVSRKTASSDAVQDPEDVGKDIEVTTFATPFPPSSATCATADDPTRMSHSRSRVSAFPSDSPAGLSRDGSLGCACDHFNQDSSGVRRGKEEKEAGTRYSQGETITSTQKDAAIATNVQFPWSIPYSAIFSDFNGVHLNSVGEGMDESQTTVARVTGSSAAIQSFPGAGGYVEVNSGIPLSPPTSTGNTKDDAGFISGGQKRESFFSLGSAVGMAQDELSEYTDNQHNYSSNDAKGEKKKGHTAPRYSKDATTVSRKDVAVATEIQLQWGPFGASAIPATGCGLQLTSSREGADEIRTCDPRANRSSTTGRCPQGVGENTEASTAATSLSPPGGNCGITDYAVRTCHGRSRERTFPPGSEAGMMQNEHLEYTDNQHNQASSEDREEEQSSPRYFRDATAAPTRQDGAIATDIQLPWNLSDVSDIFSAFFGLQRKSAGLETGQRLGLGPRAIGSSGSVQPPQRLGEESEASSSVVPMSPPGYISDGRMTTITLSPGSEGVIARDKPSKKSIKSDQISNGARGGKEEAKIATRFSEDTATVPTRKVGAGPWDLKLPWSLLGVSSISSPFHRVKPTLVETGTDETFSYDPRTTRSAVSGRRSQGADSDSEASTAATPMSPSGVRGTMDDTGQIRCGRARVGNFTPSSRAGLVQDDGPEDRNSELNQAVIDTKRVNNEEGQRCSQGTITVPTRKDAVVATDVKLPLSLSNASAIHYAFPGVQLTSAGAGADKTQPNGVRAIENSGSTQRFKDPDGDTGAAFSMIPVLPSARTRDNTDDASNIGCGRSAVSALSPNSAVVVTRDELPKNVDSQPGQISNDIRRADAEKKAGPRSSQDTVTVSVRKNCAGTWDLKLPWSLFDVSSMPSSFHRAKLASVGVGTDETFICDPRSMKSSDSARGSQGVDRYSKDDSFETPLSPLSGACGTTDAQVLCSLSDILATSFACSRTEAKQSCGAGATGSSDAVQRLQGTGGKEMIPGIPVSPPTSTYHATDDAGHITHDRTMASAFSPGSRAGLAHDEMLEYAGSQPHQISGDTNQGKEKEQMGSQYSQDPANARQQNDVPVATEAQLPWSLCDVERNPSTLREIQLTTVRVETNKTCRCDSNAIESSDAGRRQESTNKDSEVTTSVTPSLPSAGTRGTMDNAVHTSHAQVKASPFPHDSTTDLARDYISEAKNNLSSRASNVARRRKEADMTRLRYSLESTRDPTRKGVAVATEVQVSLSPCDSTTISASPKEQPTTSRVGTNERRKHKAKALRSSNEGRHFQATDEEAEVATPLPPMSPSIRPCTTTDNADKISRCQIRASVFSPGSRVNLEREKFPEDAGNQPNQTSNDARRQKEEEQIVPPGSQSSTIPPTLKNVTSWNLSDFTGSLFASPKVQEALAGENTEEIRGSGARASRNNFDSSGAPQAANGDVEAEPSVTRMPRPFCTSGSTNDVGYTNRNRKKASSLSRNWREDLTPHETSGYSRNRSIQASRGTRRRNLEKQVISRCSHDAAIGCTRKNVAESTKTDSPTSFGDYSERQPVPVKLQLISIGVGTDERSRNGSRAAKTSSDPDRRAYDATGDHEATATVNLRSSPTCTCDKLSRYTSTPFNQAEQAELGYSQCPATARARKDVVDAAKVESPSSVDDISGSHSASPGVQRVSVGARTDERHLSGPRVTKSSWSVGWRPQGSSSDSEAAASVTFTTTPTSTCVATDHAYHNRRGRTGVSSLRYGSGDLARNECSGYSMIQSHQALRSVRRGEKEKQTAQYSQDTTRTRKDVADTHKAESPGSADNIMENPVASPTVQLTSVGAWIRKRRHNRVESTRSSSDASWRLQGAIGDTKVEAPVILISPRTYTDEAIAGTGYTRRYQTKKSYFTHVSGAGLPQKRPSGYTENQPIQSSNDAERGNDQKRFNAQRSQYTTTARKRKDVAAMTKSETSWSLDDMARSPPASARESITLLGIETGERRLSVTRDTWSSSGTCGRCQATSEDTEDATSVTYTYLSLPTVTSGATHDSRHTSCSRTRARAIDTRSAEKVAQHGPSGYVGTPNQTLIYSRRWEEEVRVVSRFSQGASSTPAQRYDTVTAEAGKSRGLEDTMADPSTSPKVEPSSSSLGPRTQEMHRSDTRDKRDGLNTSQRPQADCRNMKATTTVNVAYRSPPITRGTTHDAHDASYGRTTARDVHLEQGVDFAWHKPSENASKNLNQGLSDVREGNQQERRVSRCSQDTNTAFKRRYFSVTTNTELPGSLGNSIGEGSSPLGVHMTSVETGMDESHRRDTRAIRGNSDDDRRIHLPSGATGAATSVTVVCQSPPIILRIAGHGSHSINSGRTRERAIGFGAASDVVRQEPTAYAGKQHNVALSDKRGNKEEHGVPRYSQGATTTTTQNNAVQLTSVGVETDKRRRRRAMVPCSNSNPDGRPQASCEVIEAATAVSLVNPIITPGATHDAPRTSHNSTRAGNIDSGSAVDMKPHEPSRYVRDQLDRTLSDARRRKEENQGLSQYYQSASTTSTRDDVIVTTKAESSGSPAVMASKEVGTEERRLSGMSREAEVPTTPLTPEHHFQPSTILGTTHDAYHTKHRYKRARTTDSNPPAADGCLFSDTSTRATRNSLNAGQRSHATGGSNKAGTSMTVVCQSPLVTPCGATPEAHHNNFGNTGARAISSGSAVHIARHEPSGYVGKKPHQYVSNGKLGDGEEQGVPQYSQDATRTGDAVTTDAECFGSLEVQLTSERVGTEAKHRNRARATWKTPAESQWPQGASVSTETNTSVTLVYRRPPNTPPEAPHDAHQISRGRTGTRAIDSGDGPYVVRHEPLGYVGNRPNHSLTDARRDHGQEQGMRRYSSDAATDPIEKYGGVTTQADGNQLNHAPTYSIRWKEEEQAVPICFQNATTDFARKHVVITTEAGPPGSLHDTIGDLSTPPGVQVAPLEMEIHEPRPSGAGDEQNISNDGQRPQVTTKAATSVTMAYQSPPIMAPEVCHDAHQTSHGRTGTKAIDCDEGPYLVLHEPFGYADNQPNRVLTDAKRDHGQEHGVRRYSSDAATDPIGRCTAVMTQADGNQLNHASAESIRWNEEERAVPICFQNASTDFPQKHVAITTELRPPGSLHDTVGDPSAPPRVQMAALEVETQKPGLSGVSVVQNISKEGQRPQVTTDAATCVTVLYRSSPVMAPEASHDAHQTSRGQTGTRAINSGEGPYLVWDELSGYAGNQPNQALTDTKRGHGQEQGMRRYSSDAATNPIGRYITVTTQAHGNQLNHAPTDPIQWMEEEQAVPRCFQNATTDFTRKYVAITTEEGPLGSLHDTIGDSSAPPGVQMAALEIETDKPRPSGASVAQNISNDGQRPQVASKAAISVTVAYQSPPVMAPEASHNAHQTSRGRTGTRDIDSGEEPYVVLHEPSGYADNQPNQVLTDADRGHGQEQGVGRYFSDAATDPIGRYVTVTTQADGNQLSRTSTDPIRWMEEEQAVPGCFQNATTDFARKHVVITTEAGPPGSLHDKIGDPSAPPGVQMAALEIGTQKPRPSVASVVQNISNDEQRPQVASEAATSVTVAYQSPPVMAPEASHDAHQTSRGRTGTRAIDPGEEPYVVRHEPSGYADNQPNQVLADTKRGHGQEQGVQRYSSDAATDPIGRYVTVTTQADGNQLNHTSTDPIRWKGEEQAVPGCFQNATTDFARKHVVITTEAGPPGSLHDTIGDPSALPGVQMAPLEMETHEPCPSGASDVQNISNDEQRPQVTSEAATSVTVVYQSPPVMAPEVSHDAHQTSRGRTGTRAIDSGERPYLMRHELSGYAENRPNQVLTDAKRGHGHEQGVRQHSSDAATDPIERYITVMTQADGNQLNHTSADSIPWIEKEQAVPRCFQNATTDFTRKHVVITTEAGPPGSLRDRIWDPSAPPGVQMAPLEIETHEPRPSGANVVQNISNDGQRPQVTSEAATSVTMVYQSPPIMPPEVSHDPHQTSRDRRRTRASDSGDGQYVVRHEPLGHAGNRPNQVLTDAKRDHGQEQGVRRYSSDAATDPTERYIAVTIQADGNQLNHASTDPMRWKEEEQAVPGCFRNDTTDFTQKHVAITTKGGPPGSLHDTIGDPSAPPRVRMAPLEIEVDKLHPSGLSGMQNISNDVQRPQVTSESATSVTVVYQSPPIMPPEASYDAYQTSRGRTGTRAIDSGEGPYLVRHEPFGYAGSRPNQVLTDAKRGHGQEQGVRRYSSDTATDSTGRYIAITTQADGSQLNHASTDPIRWKEEEQAVPRCFQNVTADFARKHVAITTEAGPPASLHGILGDPSAPPEVQMAPLETETHKLRPSGESVVQNISNDGQRPQVTSEATTSVAVVYQSSPTLPPEASHDAHKTSRGRTGTKAIDCVEGLFTVRHESSRNAGNQPHQALSAARRRNEEKQKGVLQRSQYTTTAFKRKSVAVTTEAASSALLGVQLTSVGVGTAERSARPASDSPDASGRFRVTNSEDTEATTSTTLFYQSSPITTHDATHDAHCTNRGHTRAGATNSGQTEDFMGHERSNYARKHLVQASNELNREHDNQQGVPICIHDNITARMQRDVAVRTTAVSPESLDDFMTGPSLFGVQLTSVMVGTDGKRLSGVSAFETSSKVGERPQVSRGDAEAGTSVTPECLSTCFTRGATRDAQHTSGVRMRVTCSSFGPAVNITYEEPSVHADIQPSQALKYARHWKQKEQVALRCSQDATTAPTQTNVAVMTEAKSLESVESIVGAGSSSLGVQLTYVGGEVDGRRRSDGRTTGRSLGIAGHAPVAIRDTHAAFTVTPGSPPSRTWNASDGSDHIRRGRANARDLNQDSAADLTRHEPQIYTGNQHIYTSIGTHREEEKAQAVSPYPQDTTAAPTRMDTAVAAIEESPLSPGDLTGTLPASFGVQVTSVGIGTEENRGKCTRATGRSSDAGWSSQRARESTEVATSMTVVSPSLITRDTTHHVYFTTHGRTKARAISLGSAAGPAREEPLEFMCDEPNHPLKDGIGGKKGVHILTHAFSSATTATTQKDVAIATEAQPPESLGDVPAKPSMFYGVKLTSVGVGTDGRPRSGARAIGRSSNVGERPQGARRDAETVTTLTPVLPPSSTWDVMGEPGNTSRDRKRVRTIIANSITEHATHLPSGYTDHYPPNQISIDTRRRNKQNQVVLISSQRASKASTRKDVAVGTESQGNPRDVSKRSPAFFEVQLTSVGLQTNERHRSGAGVIRNSSDGGRRPHMSRRNAGSSTSMVPVSSPISSQVATGNPDPTCRGRARARAISSGLAVGVGRLDPIENISSQSAQGSSGVRRRERLEGSVPRFIRDATVGSMKNNVAVKTGPEPWVPSASPQVQLASVSGLTDGRRHNCIGLAASEDLGPSPMISHSTIHSAHRINRGRTRARGTDLGSVTDKVRDCYTIPNDRLRARSLGRDFTTDLEREKLPEHRSDHANQASTDTIKREGETPAISRLFEGVFTACKRKDNPVSTGTESPDGLDDVTLSVAAPITTLNTPSVVEQKQELPQNGDTFEAKTEPRRSLGDTTRSPWASPRIPLTLVGMGTDERRCSDIVMADAVAPVHPLIITHDVHHTIQRRTRRGIFGLAEAAGLARNDYISHNGRTRARALSLDSPPGFARGEFFANPGNRPDQTSTGAKPVREEEQVVPRLVLNLPTGPTRKDFAVIKETETPKGLENTTWSPSASPGVQLTSEGERKDDKHRIISGLATSATLTPSPILARGTTHAHQTVYSLTRARVITRDSAVDLADNRTSLPRRPGARAIRFDSKVDVARTKPPGYTDNQANQVSTDVRRRKREVHKVPRFLQDTTTANARKNLATQTKARTPGSLSHNHSAFSGVQLTSGGKERSSRRTSTSVTLLPSPIISRSVTHDPHHTIHNRKEAGAVGLESTTGLVQDGCNIHGCRKRARPSSLESTVSLTRDKPLGCTDNQPNKPATGPRLWNEKAQEVPQFFKNAPTALSRSDRANETKAKAWRSIDGIMASSTAFPGVQVASAGVGADERCLSSTEVVASVTLASSPIITHSTTHDAHDTIHGQTRAGVINPGLEPALARDDCTNHGRHTRAKALSLDSSVSFARDGSLAYTGDQPNQAITAAGRWNEEKLAVPQPFHVVHTASTTNNTTPKTKAKVLGSVGDLTSSYFASPEAHVTSVGLRTNDSGCNVNGVINSAAPISSPNVTTSATHDPYHTNRGRTRASAASLGSAAGLKQYDRMIHGHLIRAVAFSPDSTAELVRDKASGYTGNQPNETLTGARGWKEDEQSVSRSFYTVPTAPAQNCFANNTKPAWMGSLDDGTGTSSGFSGVQLTSVGRRMEENRRSGTGVATSATLIASPAISHGAIYDARHPIVGRTRAGPSSHGSTAPVVQDDHSRHVLHTRAKHLVYISNQPKQALIDARRWQGEEQGKPRSFQNVNMTFTKSNAVFRAKKGAQRSFGGVVVCTPPSGEELTPVRTGTYEKRPSDATHDTHDNICRQSGASARCRGSAVRLAHNKPFGRDIQSHLNQVLGDTKPDKEDKYAVSQCPPHANTASAQRILGVGTESELSGRLGYDHGIISVSSGKQLVSLGAGTGERRPSCARVTWSPDAGRRHQDAGEGVGTTTSVTVLSSPILTRDATHQIHPTIRGKTRASERRHGSVADFERHEPRGYTYTGIPRNKDLNDTRPRYSENVVRRYSRDVATVCTHKESAAESPGLQGNAKGTISGFIGVQYIQLTSPGGTTDERRADGTRDRCIKINKYKLDADAGIGARIAISANPKLSPISIHSTKYDASHTRCNRPRAFVPGSATGSTEGESWGFAGNQSSSGARGWNEHMEKGRGAVKVDLDADYCVSEDGDLIPEEKGEEGHHGRIYLPDGRFVVTLGVSPDSNSGDHGEFPTEGAVKSDHGKDDELLEYDMDDFEDCT